MANTLTWLHLSDLHMRPDALDDLGVVLEALWRDLPAQIAEVGGKLDFIAFTGDIAYSGKEEEYKLAEEHFFQPLLKATELSPLGLFVVPGNHDVDWRAIQYLNPDIPASLTDRAKVTDFLTSDDKLRFLFAPMASYAQFIQHFFGEFPEHPILRDPLYSYVHFIRSVEQSIALICLNSAWFSGFTKDARGNVMDRGNLLIGDKQIGDAIREAEGAKVRIALMHHPPSWLKEFDELDIQRWLRPSCDFVLQGHLHFPNFEEEKALGRETINIPAGAVYKGREWLNGYNLIQLDFETGRGKIILRRYGEERREWVKDVQSTGDDLDGLVEFDLPASLALAVPPPSPSMSRIEPDWLRLGRERETQLLETFLRQKSKDALWIWGEDGCGSKEFLQIARTLLQHEAVDMICFDAEDAVFGVAVDQHYFLNKLEHWIGIPTEAPSDRPREDVEERQRCVKASAETKLIQSDRRLVLIFANFHLLLPAIREWVWNTLWGQVLEPVKKHGILALFACEGPAPACPARAQENKIYLAEFSVQDVERFLGTLPFVSPDGIPDLARKIHSETGERFLASPQHIYRNLIIELNRLNPPEGIDERTT